MNSHSEAIYKPATSPPAHHPAQHGLVNQNKTFAHHAKLAVPLIRFRILPDKSRKLSCHRRIQSDCPKAHVSPGQVRPFLGGGVRAFSVSFERQCPSIPASATEVVLVLYLHICHNQNSYTQRTQSCSHHTVCYPGIHTTWNNSWVLQQCLGTAELLEQLLSWSSRSNGSLTHASKKNAAVCKAENQSNYSCTQTQCRPHLLHTLLHMN